MACCAIWTDAVMLPPARELDRSVWCRLRMRKELRRSLLSFILTVVISLLLITGAFYF